MQSITIPCQIVGIAVDDGTTTIRLESEGEALANLMTPEVPNIPLMAPHSLTISFPENDESIVTHDANTVAIQGTVDGIERVKGGPQGDGPDRTLLNAADQGEHIAQILLDPKRAVGIPWGAKALFTIQPA